MELGKSGLKDLLRTAARNGWSDKTINDFVDSVWREKWPWPDEVIHGDVTWNSGLSFTGSVAKYRIDNLYYRAPQTAITLDAADATYPRIDLITLNTSRQWQVIKGTAAANPLKPTYNRNTNIAVTFVHLAAGGTEPEYIEDVTTDKYVTGISWNEETGILTLTRSGGLPALTAEITGAGGGADGREIELRENAGWVEWRYVGDVSWTQLHLVPVNTDEKVKLDAADTAGYLSEKVVAGEGITITEATGANGKKLVVTNTVSVEIVSYFAANETELLAKWSLAIATGKNCTIYLIGTITLTGNRTFNRSAGDPWIAIEGSPQQIVNIGNNALEASYVHFKNIDFRTSGLVYLYCRNGYLKMSNVYFHSEVAYDTSIANMKTHIAIVGSAVSVTGRIDLTNVQHASLNDVTLNNSGDIQPIVIDNQATGFDNLYFSLTYLDAMVDYDRFSRLLIVSTVTAGWRVTGDLSWFYHPNQNFSISSKLMKKGSVDDLRADYIASGTLSKIIGVDSAGKIKAATGAPAADNSVTPLKLSAEFKNSVAIAATNIDWAAGVRFTKTITSDTAITFSNLHVGVKFLEITGNFAVTLPSGFTYAGGTRAASGVTLIQVVCTTTTGPVGWYIILKAE